MKTTKKFFLGFVLLVWVLFSGCASAIERPATRTSTPIEETIAFTPTPTFLPPSATLTLLKPPTQFLPTQTPFPTLSSEEAKTILFELLQDNGGCRLPCLLGYSPMTSTRQDIQNFFNQFRVKDTSDISISRTGAIDGTSIGFYIRFDKNYLNLGVSTYEDSGQVEAFGMGSFLQPKFDISYVETMKYYMLPQILANYGEPSQVLVLTFRNDRQRPDVTSFPFYLLLIYQDQGFYIQYEMDRVNTGINFKGCPSESFVSLVTWAPEDHAAYEKMMEATILGNYLSGYKSISEATDMTKEEFYQVFLSNNVMNCIVTPIETWPNP